VRLGLGEHVCAYVAAEREDGVQVDLEDFVPVVVGELMAWVAALDACAVDEDLDGVSCCEDGGCYGGYGGWVGELGGVDGRFAAELLDCLLGFGVGVVALEFKSKLARMLNSNRGWR
jgi:hypothetical protein